MTKRIKPTEAATVETYLAARTGQDRADLTALRGLIRTTVPQSVEGMEYKMPVYRFKGELMCAIAAQKNYLCLYMMCDTGIVQRHAAELGHLDVGKSCIRFKRLEELPLATVRKMLREACATCGG